MLPQSLPATFLVQDSLKQRTPQLLHLVDEKGQHHQCSEYHGQVLLAVSIVVFEVIPSILQGIERLIFDLPPCPSTAHDRENIPLGDAEICHPTKVLVFALSDFPLLHKVHQQAWIRFVQGHLVDEGKAMQYATPSQLELGRSALLTCERYLLK